MHTHAYTCIHMHTHAYACIHMHTHAYTCIHMHTGARLPPGVIECCVGSVSVLKGYKLLGCWRHGALLTDASREGGEAERAAALALLELTSSELRVEVRGGVGGVGTEEQMLRQLLTPLVCAVEHVLSEYPGFLCERK